MKSTALAAALATASLLASPAPALGDVERIQVGQRVTENVPAIPDALVERLARYQNTRGAGFAGWLPDGGMLVTTRFGETNQVHRLAGPGMAREQLTFFAEPVGSVASPHGLQDGFMFTRDVGGSEFWQLFHYDIGRREARMLSDGESRNQGPVWSHDGSRIAYGTTRRNGRDTDLHVVTLDGDSRAVLEAGGTWFAGGFSRDGRRLLATRFVSINESYPHILDLDSGELTPIHGDGDPAGYGGAAFAHDGGGIFYTSDADSEFRELRHRDLTTGKSTRLSADIPWDVQGFAQSNDGSLLAFTSNEDGISRLHLRRVPGFEPIELPELPVGLIGLGGFSPDDRSIALTINSATSPSDVYSLDLAHGELVRWTRSEVGGLDTAGFVEPTLVHYPTFDEVDGAPRMIPAFYYRPRGEVPEGGFPVVVNIHGGPEAQARPGFSPTFQFLANELGVAVLVPNVRGSAGYGKSYLLLDNGVLREDSVRDIGALLDWIDDQPELDAGRVGVQGGSYGGYMVLASMVHYNDRLRAGINVVGISNFVTFLENTESYRRDLRRAEYGDERDPEMRAFLESISPLNNAERINRPLFVAQGYNDPRVPASEAEQIVEAVRGNGGDVWYLLFMDEGHGFAKKTNSDFYTAASMLFWQHHLLD